MCEDDEFFYEFLEGMGGTEEDPDYFLTDKQTIQQLKDWGKQSKDEHSYD